VDFAWRWHPEKHEGGGFTQKSLGIFFFFFNAQAHKDWQLAGVGVGSILVRSLAFQAGRLYCHSVL